MALGLGGCGKQSILSTRSKPAHDIALLWWWMLAAATVVFLGAVAMLAVAWFRRERPGLPFVGEREDLAQGMVLLFGIVVPLVALIGLFGVSDVYLVGQTAPPNPRTTRMTIDVIGHQWWWEVRYDGGRAITANEIHIPANTRVNVVATSADVIHSFWVPALNRKIDTIPGQQNRILLYSNKVGVFRGDCAEFCGLQHAHMGMLVFVQPKAQFQSWLQRQAQPAATPATPVARRGEQVFLGGSCSSCHAIRGTPARGFVGPDLTHLASRTTLAGLTIPNSRSYLSRWIVDSQHFKPGNDMPDFSLRSAQLQSLVAYLEGLK